ncbi:MAG TPA: ATP-binding protein [Candidatus Nitrosopolaris sp.]|nr:ATP-binding protein [Candidatus Nitrosopolaris sp.]
MINYEDKYDSNLETAPNTANRSTPLSSHTSTFIIKGRKNALMEAYNKSLTVKHSYYCVTGEELVKSYKPFVPLLQVQIGQLGGSSLIITNLEKKTLQAIKDLTEAGAQIRHIETSSLRRCVIYDDKVAYFSIVEPIITHSATENVDQTEGDDFWVGSTDPSVVQLAKKHFFSDWKIAVPAEKKIREIKEGITIRYGSKIFENEDEVLNRIKYNIEGSDELLICTTQARMRLIYNNFLDSYKKILTKYKHGKHKGIRWVGTIEKDSISLVRFFLDMGVQIRHVKNLPPLNFGIGKEFQLHTPASLDEQYPDQIQETRGETTPPLDWYMLKSLLTSDEPTYVNRFNALFEELWRNGIDAVDRIRDIEEGVDLADIKIIQNPKEGLSIAWSLIRSAHEEVLIMFSTANAFRRQIEVGGLQLLSEAALQRNVKIRLLIPNDEKSAHAIEQVKSECPWLDIRILEENLRTKITIVIADKKECIIVELRADSRDISSGAAGLSTYSNSKSIVSSYAIIFESLWKQTKLFEQLKAHDKLQEDFINIAAHELRTPIHPLVLSSEALKGMMPNDQIVSIIYRNAKKLHVLVNDILDASRIESQSLRLNKEKVNLNDVILLALRDIKTQVMSEDLRLSYEHADGKDRDIRVEADKEKLNQVICNLLSNAVKFTKKGTVTISVTIQKKGETIQNTTDNSNSVPRNIVKKENGEVIVSVKDTGTGIDPHMIPRLFSKFATNSFDGTGLGLGLFISKSMIDAHGGKMWAENNQNGKGATFAFSLPISSS